MPTSIFRTWQKRLESGVFTKSQCQQWARVIVPLTQDREPRGHRTNLTADEADVLMVHMRNAGGMRLTDEHTAQGLSWLIQNAKKRLPDLPDVWNAFSHFLYMGEAESYGTSYARMYVPVWRIVLRDGTAWDYFTLSWQTGQRDADVAWQSVRPHCAHCGRSIVKNAEGVWIDPEAPATPEDGDDHVWRETCDRHDTFIANHEPEVANVLV